MNGNETNPTPVVSNGVLRAVSTAGGLYWWRKDLRVDFSRRVTLEARLRVLSSNYIPNIGTGTREGYYFVLFDGNQPPNYTIGLADGGFNLNSISRPNQPLTVFPIADGRFHTFRFDVVGAVASLFIDGTLVASQVTPTIDATNSGYYNVSFGPGAGVSRGETELEYLCYKVKEQPAVSWEPAPLVYGQPVGSAQLNASSDVAGVFTYSIPGGTILAPGAHSVTARFTPDDAEQYEEVVWVATITVAENRPPKLLVGGPYWVYPETLLNLNAVASDPDGDAVSVQWDLDGNGTFEASGETALLIVPAFSTAVAVRAVDRWGAVTSAAASVVVVDANPPPGPLPGPIDPYFDPRPSFVEWDTVAGRLRANYGPRFEPDQLSTTCAVASGMLGGYPLWRVERTGLFGLRRELKPNYDVFVGMQRALPAEYKYVGLGYAVKCGRLPIPGGADLAGHAGLSLDCPQLRQLYIDLAGETPETTLANALPIPESLKELIRKRLVLCPFKFDLSGIPCQQKIEIATELAQIALPGLGAMLNSPVGKFLANSLLCGIDIEIPDMSFEFPDVDWGLGGPGCWFGCGSGRDGSGGGDGGGDDGGSGGESWSFYWDRLPSFGRGDWDWRFIPPTPPTGPGNYVDCALLPSDWQSMNWRQLVDHGASSEVSAMTMLDVLAACTLAEPVAGLPFRSDASVSVSGPSSVLVGDPATYDLTVRTSGPGSAPVSRVMVTTSAEVEVVPGGPCHSVSATTARCDFGSVVVGAERSIPLSLRFLSAGPAVIRAGLVAYVVDSNLADNVTALDVRVDKRIPVISWTPSRLTYGQGLSGAQLNAAADTPGTFEYSIVAGTVVHAGVHTITATFTPDDQARYDSVMVTAVVTVLPAPLVVTLNDVSREFGSPNPPFTARFDGLVNGETPAVLDGVLAFSTAATPSSPVGSYSVSASGLASTNYAITYTPGTLRVVDTTPPDIDSVAPDIPVLWSPNHKMVSVTIAVSATDAASSFTCGVVGVSSNEPVNGTGDGDTGPDWEITGAQAINLRAERAGSGSGRVYTIQIACRDAYGNASNATTTVSVPHSRKR